jgi:hypothetical protein
MFRVHEYLGHRFRVRARLSRILDDADDLSFLRAPEGRDNLADGTNTLEVLLNSGSVHHISSPVGLEIVFVEASAADQAYMHHPEIIGADYGGSSFVCGGQRLWSRPCPDPISVDHRQAVGERSGLNSISRLQSSYDLFRK